MGLDFDNSDAHWSYSGFRRFREKLAEHEEFDLDAMAGFSGERSWDEIDTPLKPFLDHSDCDGELTPEECAQVAPRLLEICESWDDGYDKSTGLGLTRDMQRCAENGETLGFC